VRHGAPLGASWKTINSAPQCAIDFSFKRPINDGAKRSAPLVRHWNEVNGADF
jgi:hypothetical protein